jgi:hypothetical protein
MLVLSSCVLSDGGMGDAQRMVEQELAGQIEDLQLVATLPHTLGGWTVLPPTACHNAAPSQGRCAHRPHRPTVCIVSRRTRTMRTLRTLRTLRRCEQGGRCVHRPYGPDPRSPIPDPCHPFPVTRYTVPDARSVMYSSPASSSPNELICAPVCIASFIVHAPLACDSVHMRPEQ